jgi:hypothetical protein
MADTENVKVDANAGKIAEDPLAKVQSTPCDVVKPSTPADVHSAETQNDEGSQDQRMAVEGNQDGDNDKANEGGDQADGSEEDEDGDDDDGSEESESDDSDDDDMLDGLTDEQKVRTGMPTNS